MGDPARTSADEIRLAVALGLAELEPIAQRAGEVVEGRAEKVTPSGPAETTA